MSKVEETLIPKIGVVTEVRVDTPDVKTFRVVAPEGGKVFEHMPGQCAMLSIPGVGKRCSLSHPPRRIKNLWSFPSKNAAA